MTTQSRTLTKVMNNQQSIRTLESRGFEMAVEKRVFKAQGDPVAQEHTILKGWKHPKFPDKVFSKSEAFKIQL